MALLAHDHFGDFIDSHFTGVNGLFHGGEVRQRSQTDFKPLVRSPFTAAVVLPVSDQRFSVTCQSDAFYFCLQCRKSIQDTLEYPLIIHQPNKHDHFAFAAFLIIADHRQNVINSHGFCFKISNKRMDIHAPITVNKCSSGVLFSNVLPCNCFPDAHRPVYDDNSHINHPLG